MGANESNNRACICFIAFLLLLSSLFIVFHTHVVLNQEDMSGAKNNRFVANKAHKNLEFVIDIPLPAWLESRYTFKEPDNSRLIAHDINDKSLNHIVPSEHTNSIPTQVDTAPIAILNPPSAQHVHHEQLTPPISQSKSPPSDTTPPIHPMSPPSDTTPPIHPMSPPVAKANSQAELDILDESCPHIEEVKFWKASTERDLKWHNPYVAKGVTKYVTFEPDVGGWNNIRMQMEIVLVFAYATGRILVLPPDQPMYLLNKGKGHDKHHNFRDFFPFDRISTRVPVISMEEFMALEGVTGHLRRSNDSIVQLPPGNKTTFDGTDRIDRNLMWEYLRNVTACPPWKGMADYVVIPPFPGFNSSKSPYAQQYRKKSLIFAGDPKFGATRLPRFYDVYWHQQHVIHFISKPGLGYRLLEHFYTFLHFEDPFMDRFYKRFVRDYVHYLPQIFCKAAIIVKHLRQEGGGVYSSFHVRRGELQYKEVKVNASVLMKTVRHVLPPGDLLFIASDETSKNYFDPFKDEGFTRIRRLDDYFDIAQLQGMNPNYLGMLDQVVCAGGRVFVGTWYSTFSAYITRMRGYLGYPDNSTWYGDVAHLKRFQKYELPRFPFYMREFPLAWHQIEEKTSSR